MLSMEFLRVEKFIIAMTLFAAITENISKKIASSFDFIVFIFL
jgi:hypothetical protein